MTMADRSGHDTGKHVQVASVFVVVDELHGAISNDQRLTVERLEHWIEMGPMNLVDLVAGKFGLCK